MTPSPSFLEVESMMNSTPSLSHPLHKIILHNFNTSPRELVSILQECTSYVEKGQFHPVIFDAIRALHLYASVKARDPSPNACGTKIYEHPIIITKENKNSMTLSPDNTDQIHPKILPTRETSRDKDRDDGTTFHHPPMNSSPDEKSYDTMSKYDCESKTINVSKETSDESNMTVNRSKLASTLREFASDVERNKFSPQSYSTLGKIHTYASNNVKWNPSTLFFDRDWILTSVLTYLPGQYLYVAPVCKKFERLYLKVHSQSCKTMMRAGVSSIPCLEWALRHGFPWNKRTCSWAARNGRMDVLQWARSRGCPWSKWTCAGAAYGGHLDVLRWAREEGCDWDVGTCEGAASNGHLEVLRYVREEGCDWDKWTCLAATAGGHLDLLRWAREEGCPWDRNACLTFAKNRKTKFWIEYGIDLKDE